MQHPDEGMIHTWVDGQLPAEESSALESHVATCERCSAAVAEARGFKAGASRIVSALDIVPGGVIPIAKPRQRAWYEGTQFRAAAAVLVIAGASLLLVKKENQTQLVPTQVNARLAENSTTPSAQAAAANVPSTTVATPASPARQAEGRASSVTPVASSIDPLAKASAVAAAKVSQNARENVSAVNAAARLDAVTRRDQKDALSGRVSGVVVTGVASETSRATGKAFEQRKAGDAANPSIAAAGIVASEPRLFRVDSTKTPRQRFYTTASGATLVLTEIEAPAFADLGGNEATAMRARKTMSAPRNSPAATRVMSPPAAPVPDPMIPFPNGGAAHSAAKVTINTITWFDETGLRRYILSGPVSFAELEAAKVFLKKAQQ